MTIGSSQYARRGAGFGGDVVSRNYVAITLTKLYRFLGKKLTVEI